MEEIKRIWNMENLRKKILFTFAMIMLFRIGCSIPIPFVNPDVINGLFSGESALGYINLISGGALEQTSLFALGISGYINASIVVQLFVYSLSLFENEDDKEKEKKIKKLRYAFAGFFYFVMAIGYYFMLRNFGALRNNSFLMALATVVVYTIGGLIVLVIGKLIDEKGIGNGISLIILTGIVHRLLETVPYFVLSVKAALKGQVMFLFIGLLAALFVIGSLFFVVFADGSEKRIPIKYAGGVKGGQRYKGQETYIPFRLMINGVLPVIFASTILSIPALIAMFLDKDSAIYSFLSGFKATSILYIVLYAVLIYGFNMFYLTVQYNIVEMANNLRINGAVILGYRPGKPTINYLTDQMKHMAKVGSVYLAAIAIAPIVFQAVTGYAVGFAGTGSLIVVGVSLELIRQIETETTMHRTSIFR